MLLLIHSNDQPLHHRRLSTMGPDLALSDCEAYSLLRSGDKEGSQADYFMAPVAMTLPIIGADIPGPPLQCLSEQKAVSPGHCAAHLYSRTRDGYLENVGAMLQARHHLYILTGIFSTGPLGSARCHAARRRPTQILHLGYVISSRSYRRHTRVRN